MTQRVFNFNPGPAALPLVVLEQVKMEMLDFQGSGMSVLEISHRSKSFETVLESAIQRVRRLLGLDDSYQVLFIQGGASLQFTMVPMNLAVAGKPADYVNTGTWSTRAIKEARTLGKEVRVVATSEEMEFTFIPERVPAQSGCSVSAHNLEQHYPGHPVEELPGSGGCASYQRHVLRHIQPQVRSAPLRADLRRGAEKHRSGGGYAGHYSQRYAGKSSQRTSDDAQIYDLF